MKSEKKHLTISKVASHIGVSNATIKNWIRHDYLKPIIEEGPTLFIEEDVLKLQDKLRSGEINRLNTRANKRSSAKKFIPKEYSEVEKSNEWLTTIINHISNNSLELEPAVFYLALNVLIADKFIYTNDASKILSFNEEYYKNSYLRDIFKEYYSKLISIPDNGFYQQLLGFYIPTQRDVLGLLYQSIKSEGDKAKQGSYYTPKNIVDDIVFEHVKSDSTVLDPCCGTGQFLLSLNGFIKDPEQIYGLDIDRVAVFICKLNLIMAYSYYEFEPKVFHIDSLLEFKTNSLFSQNDFPDGFDIIITNPPWGLHFSNDNISELKFLYPEIVSLESFSYFLFKSIGLLKSNGVLSFILPEAILNIKVHNDIRREILNNTNILKIVKLGRAFTNVFTNVIRLDLKKQCSENQPTQIVNNFSFTINQHRFTKNPDYIFDIEANNEDNQIIEKVYDKPHLTLKKNADWALGIVTGDNKKFLVHSKFDSLEEIYKGKEVNKYFLSQASHFISFEPEKFQQVAPIEKYRAKEKLIYRFISDKLVFAYDNKQKLTLNSANILIPNVNNYPIKVILALFNSSLYQFIYAKKFNTIKVLRGNLEELPLPILSEDIYNKIIKYVDEIISSGQTHNQLDILIFKLFDISESEQEYILASI
jgi:SAM-dependent methyltransferase